MTLAFAPERIEQWPLARPGVALQESATVR